MCDIVSKIMEGMTLGKGAYGGFWIKHPFQSGKG